MLVHVVVVFAVFQPISFGEAICLFVCLFTLPDDSCKQNSFTILFFFYSPWFNDNTASLVWEFCFYSINTINCGALFSYGVLISLCVCLYNKVRNCY